MKRKERNSNVIFSLAYSLYIVYIEVCFFNNIDINFFLLLFLFVYNNIFHKMFLTFYFILGNELRFGRGDAFFFIYHKIHIFNMHVNISYLICASSYPSVFSFLLHSSIISFLYSISLLFLFYFLYFIYTNTFLFYFILYIFVNYIIYLTIAFLIFFSKILFLVIKILLRFVLTQLLQFVFFISSLVSFNCLI